MRAKIVIVETTEINEMTLVACDLVYGELIPGMKFKKDSGDGEWTLLDLSSVSPDLYSIGRRGASFSSSNKREILKSGDSLTSE